MSPLIELPQGSISTFFALSVRTFTVRTLPHNVEGHIVIERVICARYRILFHVEFMKATAGSMASPVVPSSTRTASGSYAFMRESMPL